ncbi:hypothetical protein NP284_02670 [Rhodopseudomonas pseudopalustris]|uniref:hypothetical protein n=1 Tax=Rhodopseudomonas pseudopalustris TaxID=1513892 RepID=UPI003F998351
MIAGPARVAVAALVLVMSPAMMSAVMAQRAATPPPPASAAPSAPLGAPAAPTVPPSAAPAADDKPGLIDEIGKIWDKSTSMLPSLTPSPAAPDPAAAAKPAEPAPPAMAPVPAPSGRAAVPAPAPAPAGRVTAPAPAAPAPVPPPVAAPAVPAVPPPAAPPADSSMVPSMVSGRVQCPTASDGAADCKAGADQLCRSKGFREGKSLTTDSAEACSAKALIPGRQREPSDCHTNYFVTRAICR